MKKFLFYLFIAVPLFAPPALISVAGSWKSQAECADPTPTPFVKIEKLEAAADN